MYFVQIFRAVKFNEIDIIVDYRTIYYYTKKAVVRWGMA